MLVALSLWEKLRIRVGRLKSGAFLSLAHAPLVLAVHSAPGWETESVNVGSIPGQYALEWHDNLYAIGSLNPTLYKFESNEWRCVSPPLHGTVKGMVVWRDQLCVAGAFTNNAPAKCQNLAV